MIPAASVRLNSVQQQVIHWNHNSSKDNHLKSNYRLDISEIITVSKTFLKTGTVFQTALTYCKQLSELYGSNIYLKREDQQRGKTYKIRGAYEFYLKHQKQIQKGDSFVAASDGNFATAIAILSGMYKFKCKIFIPYSCFQHKLDMMKQESHGNVQIIQQGDNFQQTEEIAEKYAKQHNLIFIQPHRSKQLLIGYATVAKQIIDDKSLTSIDYVLVPSGGGALVSSTASFFKQTSPETKIIAVQPDVCTPFSSSILKNEIVSAQKVSRFCNGSSVKKIGEYPFQLGKTSVDGFVQVSENKLAENIIKLYSIGLVCEPAGGLGVAGLTKIRNQIKGKNVICIITGANMDLSRLQQVRELNLISKGYKNYYVVEVPNKKSAVYDLICKCFKKTDMISIQYYRKPTKDINQALLAVESETAEDVESSIQNLIQKKIKFQNITDRSDLLDLFF